jgi:hypothetical protein
LLPQLEQCFRFMVEQIGESVMKKNTEGGVDYTTLEQLLAAAERVLGADAIFYLKVLLTERRGWNLRNLVCHGLIQADAFGVVKSDRILHAFLVFGLVRPAIAQKDGGPNSPEGREPAAYA